ncbi:UDP-N-acetylmuramoyl-L-alanine--D-glutamate ligase [Hydrogenophaga sp. 5NK40-0174]|uniref:UDP-N-acetylmuramoyl-L-alanine--D-glutamate ligase n=1 Tax=Hydrogenophaga sp. 5NK40-0174 TaxID=3127649 RepID=UPI003103F490
MSEVAGQNVLVLGLGVSGLAMARWLTRQGACVTVADTREAPPQLQALQSDCPGATFVCTPFDRALMDRADWSLVAKSPGLAPDVLAEVLAWATEPDMQLVGELELFARALRDLGQRQEWPYHPKVLAITGTNGKTTVTSLASQLLDRCEWRVATAGNIGPSMLDVLAAALDLEVVRMAEDEARAAEEAAQAAAEAAAAAESDEVDAETAPDLFDTSEGESASEEDVSETDADTADGGEQGSDGAADESAEEESVALLEPPAPEPPAPPHLPQVWVLELSSFQLDGLSDGAWSALPTAATVLNVTEDHLDWHPSMPAYVQAKTNVFGADALMVLNRDDKMVMAMEPELVTVKISGRNRQVPAREFQTFGQDTPERPGDWGIESLGGMDWLVRALAVDETRKRGRHDEPDEIYYQRMMPVDALRIQGRHNAMNALAALALATSTGAPLAPMLHGLREYRGEPHRVESVGLIDGVEFIDDSKGTNVGATLAAVKGLGVSRRLVVLLGGEGKGQNFEPLAEALATCSRAVILYGRDGQRIGEQIKTGLAEQALDLREAASMEEAVNLAAELAQAGDAVLLSPACASFDMFDNYVHRAEAFIDAVKSLAADRGVVLEGGA